MPVEKCPLCGGQLEKKHKEFQHVYQGVPIRLANIPQLVCADCGEDYVDSNFGQLIEDSIDQYVEFKNYEAEDLLSSEEAASLLSVSYQVVTTMLSDGKLPGTKIGREWRIPYGILMEYIEALSAHNLSGDEKEAFETYMRLKNAIKAKDKK